MAFVLTLLLSSQSSFAATCRDCATVLKSDGGAINPLSVFRVFFGSLTSQTYEVRVTDTTDGTVRTYPSPGTSCGGADTTAF